MDLSFGCPQNYSPLTLAYLGDAVFELYVRANLLKNANMPVNELNTRARKFVCAKAQARMYNKIINELTEEEKAVLKRGRNAKPHGGAKNASIMEYHRATGLEALFGYLFMKGDYARISLLFDICAEEKDYEGYEKDK